MPRFVILRFYRNVGLNVKDRVIERNPSQGFKDLNFHEHIKGRRNRTLIFMCIEIGCGLANIMQKERG